MNKNLQNQRGVGMIEILVSLVILAVGLLSVATLHVNIINQSHESKARSEAIALAESRIEIMRNYSDGITTLEEFDLNFTVIDAVGGGNPESISGTNASFIRTENIANMVIETVGEINVKDVIVYVKWTDRNNDPQEVKVSSSIAWAKPRTSGDIEPLGDPLIPSATGRARLGDGKMDTNAQTVATGDGMRLYDKGDGDYRLVAEDDVIVLTLENACDIGGGNCTDFVEISGKVYIESNASITAEKIFVKASDAAYCQLYYNDIDGDPHDVKLSTDVESTGSDYNYFRYTCYLGGGWHGNIGLILSSTQPVCVGDPTSIHPYEQPVEASRRVYRGMLYEKDLNGVQTVNDKGEDRYYSIGVEDALKLPHSGKAGHDFVVGAVPKGNAVMDCKTIMTKTDSNNGAIFAGVPDDFYCLNDSNVINDDGVDADGNDVDKFKTPYILADTCPYDPSFGPARKHTITGNVVITSDVVFDTDIVNTIKNIYLNTSDNAFNCTDNSLDIDILDGLKTYTITYTCDVYDWDSGWDGYVQVNTDYSKMACTDYRKSYTDIGAGEIETTVTTADVNLCIVGNIVTFSGNVTSTNKELVEVTMFDNATSTIKDCEFGALTYSCSSAKLADNKSWSGTLSFEATGGKLCIDTSDIKAHADFIDGSSSYIVDDPGNTISTIAFTNIDFGILSLPIKIDGVRGECQ